LGIYKERDISDLLMLLDPKCQMTYRYLDLDEIDVQSPFAPFAVKGPDPEGIVFVKKGV
jgi:hypothetical protein